jgi:hypothetical protein
VAEAVDDLDQSLEAAPEEVREPARRGIPARGAYTTVDFRLPLSLPDQPGKTIRRLRGTIPVEIPVRSSEPLAVLTLSEARGRTLTAGHVTFTIHDFKSEPDHRAILRLTARLETGAGRSRDRADQERLATRLVDIARQQIEIVDDQTRPVPAAASTSVRRNEVSVTLRVSPGEQYGAADRLRVFGLTWKSSEVPFEFKDVPMP